MKAAGLLVVFLFAKLAMLAGSSVAFSWWSPTRVYVAGRFGRARVRSN
jgi:hypothetical protein